MGFGGLGLGFGEGVGFGGAEERTLAQVRPVSVLCALAGYAWQAYAMPVLDMAYAKAAAYAMSVPDTA